MFLSSVIHQWRNYTGITHNAILFRLNSTPFDQLDLKNVCYTYILTNKITYLESHYNVSTLYVIYHNVLMASVIYLFIFWWWPIFVLMRKTTSHLINAFKKFTKKGGLTKIKIPVQHEKRFPALSPLSNLGSNSIYDKAFCSSE